MLRVLAGGHSLCLHRWIDGTSDTELDPGQSGRTIELLARLHSVDPRSLPAVRTDLAVQGRPGFDRAMRTVSDRWPGPFGERARALLRRNDRALADLFGIHDRQAADLRATQDGWVVTHGEPHARNLVWSEDGPHLIDWDTALVAPAARDVWQVGGDDAAESYRELTGEALPRWQLDYFRRDWDLAEICLYTTDFAAPHDWTADTDIMWDGFTESLDLLFG